MQQSLCDEYDILILGAGVSGCTAALALASRYNVAILDKEATTFERVGEHLPPAANRILNALSLEHLLNETKHLKSQGILSYWGSTTPTLMDHLANPDGDAWHLDRAVFESDLRNTLSERGVSTVWPSQMLAVNNLIDHWQIVIRQGEEIKTLKSKLLIDATGRRSVVARQQGVTRHQDDKLMSLWLSIDVAVNKSIAVISDVDKGWWYCAPVPRQANMAKDQSDKQRRVFCYQFEASQIDKQLQTSIPAFMTAAASVKGLDILAKQSDWSTASAPRLVAANSSRLKSFCGVNWFAIGDAAMSFDPLSSQGMYNAMATAMQLSDLLLENGLVHSENFASFQGQMEQIWQYYLTHKSKYYQMLSVT